MFFRGRDNRVVVRKHGSHSGEEEITTARTVKLEDHSMYHGKDATGSRRRINTKKVAGKLQGWEQTVGGREEDNFILIAVRALPVPSAGNKHYNHTGRTAGTSHSGAAELLQKK